MPQRNVASNFTFEQQRVEINNLAQDFWSQKGTVDTALPTFLKHDGTNNFTGQTLAVPNAFTINSNSGNGTVTIAGNLDVTGTTTTVSTANLEVTDKNILIAKGSTSDAQADGAGITIDSATDITFNFVDANDALVSSIGLEGTTFLKAPYGQFTGSGTPSGGQGVEINAPDTNTGQISSYDRASTAYKELRVKGSSIGVYAGTANALVGSFSSTGLDVTGTVTTTGQLTGNSSNTGKYVRMYGSGGTGRWDIYGHGANLRFSDNDAAGNIVFDHNVEANSDLFVGAPASNTLTHKLLVQAGADANAIAVIGRTDGIGELSFYANDASTKQGEVQYRATELNIRHRKEGAEINFVTCPTGGSITDRLTILGNGQIKCLGGAAGVNALEVTGDYNASGNVDIQTWQRTGGAVQAKMIYKDASTDMHFGTDTGHAFSLMTNGTSRLTIASGGTVTVSDKLNVVDAPSSGSGLMNLRTHASKDSYVKFRDASDFDNALTDGGLAIDCRNSANNANRHLILRSTELRLNLGSGGGTDTLRFKSDEMIPISDATYDLGDPSFRFANVYTADAHFNNIGTGGNEVDGSEGHWTMQEGENDFFLINRKNGKKYKFNLTEVS